MNENQMQSFVAAVEQGSMSRAARNQFLTVPSFVHRINSLEAELGYRVLERGQRGVTPTPHGERLYHACKQALSILHKAKSEPHSPSETARPVSVGVWRRIPPYFLRAVDELGLQERGIYLDFAAVDFNEAAEGFDRHVIDLWLGNRSRDLDERGLRYTPLYTQTYYGVFAPSSKLASLESLAADDLRDYTVYAGADYRSMPELAACADIQRLFAMDNVVKESIFVQKLIQDCVQDKAVAFFSRPDGATAIDFAGELTQLAHRPMNWPRITTGVYLANDASEKAKWLVDELARSCNFCAGC